MTQAVTFCTAVSLSGSRLRSYSRVMAALPDARPVPRRAHGSIVYLHGVGGVRPAWWRPMSRGLRGLHVDLSAPAYEDLLTTSGRVHARRTWHDVSEPRDDERRAYVQRQHRLAELVQSVGESTRMAWHAGLAAALADRLPLASMLRAPIFGLDQVGRYLDDDARRAAVLHRAATALLRAPRPRVIVAHSLGSVVAWDLLADPRIDIDLLITVGSPLAHPALAVDSVPFPYRRVGAWLNVVHPLDPVPAGRGLHDAFPAACDAFLPPLSALSSQGSALSRVTAAVAGAATSHLDSSYLASRTVLAAVREAMGVSAGLSVPTHRAVAS